MGRDLSQIWASRQLSVSDLGTEDIDYTFVASRDIAHGGDALELGIGMPNN